MDSRKPESSSSTRKWLIGCGIGCGAVILIVGVLIVGGVFFVKDLVKGFEESEAILQTLTERYGSISEFTPEPDGSIPRARMERFLSVRESMRPVVEKLEHDISFLSDEIEGREETETRREDIFSKLRAGFGLVPKLAEFLTVRNQALLDGEMGLGEYFYVYTIAYHSWLENEILDGAPFNLMGGEGGIRYEDWENEDAREVQRDLMLRRLHRMMEGLLHNQLAAAKAAGRAVTDEWQAALEAEIEALGKDRYRMVWQDGLPAVIRESLEPFRARLEQSYSPLLNRLEITIEQR
jgi:hypothetical protein